MTLRNVSSALFEESRFIKLKCVYDFISLDTLSTHTAFFMELFLFRVDIRGELLLSFSGALKNQEI